MMTTFQKNLKQEIYLYKLQLNQFPDKSEDKLNPVNTVTNLISF